MAKKQKANSTDKKRPSSRPATVSAAIEQELAASAIAKRKSGRTPTARELSALKKHEAKIEEERRWLYYESIPQKHWRQMSGRQAKVLQEQADRYGIPFGGATVNLAEVVKATHDFLASNAKKLAKSDLPDGIDPNDPDAAVWLGDAKPGDWLDRVRRATALQKELEYDRAKKQLIPRDDVRQILQRIANIIQAMGDTLGRHYGNDAVDAVNEALENIEREVGEMNDGIDGQQN